VVTIETAQEELTYKAQQHPQQVRFLVLLLVLIMAMVSLNTPNSPFTEYGVHNAYNL
jgi:hypothetical protein